MHASQDSTVCNSYFEDVRHAVTLGGSTARYGINRRISIVNNKAVATAAGSYNSHAGAEDVSIIGNISMYPISVGVSLRSPSGIVQGNIVVKPPSYGIELVNQSSRPARYVCEGNYILYPSKGIRVITPTDASLVGTTAGTTVDFINITGNSIVSSGNVAIYIENTTATQWNDISVTANHIRLCSPSHLQAIWVNNVLNFSASGNVITGLGNTTDGYTLTNVTAASISGGVISWASVSSTNSGILALASTNITISGLTVRNAATGILLGTDCSNVTIDRFTPLSCTTNLQLNTGTGHSVSSAPLVNVYTTPGANTWTKPQGAKSVSVFLVGGGAGGGSGRKGLASSVRCGGGGGGGGAWTTCTLDASLLSATVTVTVGSGGNGGPSQTTDSTDGSPGTNGVSTTFGTYARAGNGGAGGAGTATSGTAGSGSSGISSGTAGGAASATGGVGVNSTSSGGAAGGGGGGGGITSGDTANNGGTGGGGAGGVGSIAGGTAGTSGGSGGNGTAMTANQPNGGAGGGGGGASKTTNAGSGGNGATYGGGGGGGGASLDATGNSGAGGTGAQGIAVVITYF